MNKVQVLDHGYVGFVESWGHGEAGFAIRHDDDVSDFECGIIEAARQSTQGSFRGWEEDEKLLGFLFNSKPQHAGPFEFSGMTIEVQAPIFVFREWHRHRTQSYNEMSARYAPLPDMNYLPSVERLMRDGGRNTQASPVKGADDLTPTTADWSRKDMEKVYKHAEEAYQLFLSRGVPKECARVVLPVGRYSRMRASGNLRNWLGFMTLRFDPGAQWEIQQYAAEVGKIIEATFPRTWSLYIAAKERQKTIEEKAKLWDEHVEKQRLSYDAQMEGKLG